MRDTFASSVSSLDISLTGLLAVGSGPRVNIHKGDVFKVAKHDAGPSLDVNQHLHSHGVNKKDDVYLCEDFFGHSVSSV